MPGKKEAINNILSSDDVFGIDDLTIEFEGPNVGLFNIYFKVEEKKTFLIEVDDEYPPFPDI